MDAVCDFVDGWDISIDMNDEVLVWNFLYNGFSNLYPREDQILVKMTEFFKSWNTYQEKLKTHHYCCETERWLPRLN